MRQEANPHRGEASLAVDGKAYRLRPTFSALVAAEEELGPLFALVERAGENRLSLTEMAALFWHCMAEPGELTRHKLNGAVADLGLATCAKPLRMLLGQILQGSG
uniref:gene transfer agent family protein n=1 Tax=Parerythrobacter lutipelagi TaxID=1964208 RepID=UPI0010F6F50E|nr:gene transfer agent family protein [Parerythrobacter lutipelagi]